MTTGFVQPAGAGFGLGLSLIVAIGAQNAYVLRQGLRREHVGHVVAFCAASDALLIGAGIAGLGALLTRWSALIDMIRWFGAAFLLFYGLLALRRTFRSDHALQSARPATSRRSVIATVAALTWLNPHVYLDTLLLVGAVGATYESDRWIFAAGAMLASLLWFVALGFGARRLAPLFARPVAWRVLDLVIATVMMGLAVALVVAGPTA